MTPQVFQFDEEHAPAGSIYWESRVLVVGDDDLASKLSAVLRVARGSVVVASDGAAGLRLLTSTHEFTLALVDLLRIDATLVRQFRTWEAHEGAARARVVAVSHNAANVHREQGLATSNGLVTPCAVPHILESCDLPCMFCIYKYVAEIGPGCGRMHSTLHSAQRIRPRGRAARDGERGAGGRFARLERRLIRGDLAQRLAKLLSIHTGAHTHRRSDTVVGRTFPPRQGGRARKGTGNGTRSGEGASRTR